MTQMLGVSTFGDLLKTRREKLGLRERVTFAKRANVGVSTIQQIELGVGEPFHKRSDRIRHAIADVLNMPVDQLDAISREESGESDGGANEAGLAPTAMQPAPTIPEWTISTSASAWASVPICAMECDDPAQAAIVKLGRFRLRIDGRCMEPDYPHDSVVEFKIIDWEEDVLQLNADYAFCRNDGTATFKKLVKKNEDTLTLAAINQREFPGVIVVALQEIVRVARAMHILRPPPEPRELRIQTRNKMT